MTSQKITMQHHERAYPQPESRASYSDDDDDEQPLSAYTKRSIHQYESRPLIDRVTNSWKDNRVAFDSKEGYSSDDDDDEQELTHCCDLDSPNSCPNVTYNIVTSRKFRRAMIIFLSVALLCYYGWKWYLRPGWERESILVDGFNHANGTFGTQMKEKFDDIIQLQELAPGYMPGGKFDPDGKRRLVFIGDIHGCNSELQRLLVKVKFDKDMDHLIAVGDFVAKGPDSPGVIDTLLSLNASSVRGNHEDRILGFAKSRQLKDQEEDEEEEEDSPDSSFSAEDKKGAGLKGEALLPYLKKRHLAYMRSVPLIIHIPSLTTPSTPAPEISTEEEDFGEEEDLLTRKKTKVKKTKTIRHDINVVHGGLVPSVPLMRQDPFSVMHMRSMSPTTHVPSERRDRGIAWERIWGWYNDRVAKHKRVKKFSWFDEDYEDGKQPADDVARIQQQGWISRLFAGSKAGVLKREEPSVVIYGHDSPRGLNLHPWSKGLDSGCVNGNRLTALVLDAWGQTQIVSVSCKKEKT